MKKIGLVITALILSFQVQSSTKEDVQGAMRGYVQDIIKSEGFLPVVHKGKVLKLKVLESKKYPDGFHSGVKSKNNLYVSCADFIDDKGNKYDVDFLVSKSKNNYQVVQPIVHIINGEKSPYDLNH